MSALQVCFRVDFRDHCSVGIGKICLLEAIARTGSLSRAARDVGMSYRRAWLLVDSMNAEFETSVVSATVGGHGGGGAKLTAFGHELVKAYRSLEAQLVLVTEQHMKPITAQVARVRRRRAPSSIRSRERISKVLI